jgi:hypothetical protein
MVKYKKRKKLTSRGEVFFSWIDKDIITDRETYRDADRQKYTEETVDLTIYA